MTRGQRQLVGLQAGLERRAFELVVLDEPWEGLDPQGSEWLAGCLDDCRSRGAMVVLSSHRLADLAGVCDSYAFLHRGRVTSIDGDRFRRSLNASDGIAGTIRLVAKRIEYSITKPKAGHGGLERRVVASKRFT